MNADSEERQSLIAQLLAGEIDLQHSRLLAAMAEDPGFAAEIHKLLDLALELDAVTLLPPVVKQPDGGGEPWPGAERAMRGLAARELSAGGPVRQHRAKWPRLGLAAAAVLALGALWQFGAFSGTPEAAPDTPLAVGGLWPGKDATIERAELAVRGFELNSPALARATEVRLQILDLDGAVLHAANVIAGSTWRPEATVIAGLPSRFRWSLQWRGGSGGAGSWTAVVSLLR